MNDSKIKIVVADDEVLALNGISGIIDRLEGFEVVGKATNGKMALDILREKDADILITDIKMPNNDGLWLIDMVDKLRLPVTVIIVSAYDDQKYLRSAIRNPHVYDYIFKPFTSEEIIELLRIASNYHKKKISSLRGDDFNMNLMLNAITSGDVSIVDNDIEYFFANNASDVTQIKNRAYGWIMYIYHNLLVNQPSTGRIHESDVMDRVFKAETAAEIKTVFKDFVEECARGYVRSEEVTPLVHACLQIIKQELNNTDLNLNYAAGKLDVTPNYLSGKFSRDMKQSFSNYLTHYRINVAKELLNDISRKVYEVSLAVGFSDVSYFNKVFKERVGLTPLQYRQHIFNTGDASNPDRETLSEKETEELREVLLYFRDKYPLMQAEDAIKVVYHNEYGVGRVIEDEDASFRELLEEYQKASHGFGRLFDDIGNGLVMINLSNLNSNTCSLEKLNEIYVRTSREVKGSLRRYQAKLMILKKVTDEGLMPFNVTKLKSCLDEHNLSNCLDIDNSEMVKDYYHPAYRTVLKKYADFLTEQ